MPFVCVSSRQRHKNIVTILGLCLDGKLPSIITEYVIGECLKDFLKVQGRMLTWPHRVRMVSCSVILSWPHCHRIMSSFIFFSWPYCVRIVSCNLFHYFVMTSLRQNGELFHYFVMTSPCQNGGYFHQSVKLFVCLY